MNRINSNTIVISIVLFFALQLFSFMSRISTSGVYINKNFLFGLYGNNITAIYISTIIAIIIIGTIIWLFLYHKPSKLNYRISCNLLLLLVCLSSNIFDRFLYGGVADYFNIFDITRFNVADVVIIYLSFDILYNIIKNDKKQA